MRKMKKKRGRPAKKTNGKSDAVEAPLPDTGFSPVDTLSDVIEKQGIETGALAPKELCPLCGRPYRDLQAHIESKHPEQAGQLVAGEEPPEVFGIEAGAAIVSLLLTVLQKRKEDLIVPGGDWTDRAAVAHQKLLNKYFGARIQGHSELATCGICWLELFLINRPEVQAFIPGRGEKIQ